MDNDLRMEGLTRVTHAKENQEDQWESDALTPSLNHVMNAKPRTDPVDAEY